MTDSMSSEFTSFLRLLAEDNGSRYLDQAKVLMAQIKRAAEHGLASSERQGRLDALAEYCQHLIRDLEADQSHDYRYRIPRVVRDFGIPGLTLHARLIFLGCLEQAVMRFERPDGARFWPSGKPAA